MIIVTGTLHARPESLAEVMALSRAHVLRSRGEPGCLEHGVAIDANDPLRLVFFERWVDREAIGAHLKLPASRGFGKAVAALVDQPPTLSMFEASELPATGSSFHQLMAGDADHLRFGFIGELRRRDRGIGGVAQQHFCSFDLAHALLRSN